MSLNVLDKPEQGPDVPGYPEPRGPKKRPQSPIAQDGGKGTPWQVLVERGRFREGNHDRGAIIITAYLARK
jgi:hypothetical protein